MSDNYWKGCPAKMSDGRFLSDYRSATVREQYNKSINAIARDDEYRLFLQQNAKSIMDNEWNTYRRTQSCHPNVCIHQDFPTRSTPSDYNRELKLHNAVRTGVAPQSVAVCRKQEDYRMN